MKILRILGPAPLAVAVGLSLAIAALMASSYPVQASDTGICGRTQQVQDVILGKLAEVSACADVADSDLASITELIILDQETLTLQDGDFAGLSQLGSLYIHKNGLSELPEDLFDGLSALTELYLYNNELTTLPSDLFDDLSSLETLSLSYNSLDELPSDVFDGLDSLKTLELDNNDLDELPVGLFEELSGLEKLVLTANSLEEVSGGDFEDLVNLKDLRLAANDLGEVPADLLDGLSRLQTLHMYSAGLGELPSGLFEGLSSLESVILHSNPGSPFTLKAVVGDWEDGGVAIEVPEATPFELEVTLSAEGGTLSPSTVSIAGGDQESEQITVTPATADGDVTITVGSATFKDGKYEGIQAGVGEPVTVSFPGICGRTQEVQDAILALLSNVNNCAKVTDTHLAGMTGWLFVYFTSSQAVKSDDFAGLSSLKYLRLFSNQISTLPEDVFEDLDSLELLGIFIPQLEELPEDVFEGLASLKDLTVAEKYLRGLDEVVPDHQLAALPEDVFDGLDGLESLNLSNNQLTALPEDVFDGLDSLESLSLLDNQISALSKDVFDGLDSLESLTLSRNQITALPEDVFDGLDSLESLSLSRNQITALPEELFNGLGNLDTLSLAENQLTTLPEDVFDGLTNLRHLNLSDNQLTTLPEDVFDGLGRLSKLTLTKNKIGQLPPDVFDGLSALQVLLLEDNQLAELPDGIFDGIGNLTWLSLNSNPGAPFTFTAELEQEGNAPAVVVKVAQGAPADMSISLSAAGGVLSATTATVVAGSTKSDPIAVTASGDGEITVSVDSAQFENLHYVVGNSRTGLGNNLTLENSSATGAPTISGTPQVGQTLTAGTSGISDANGLDNMAYSYQWLADDTDIDGATSSTYEVQSSDNGKVIKVRVTFTDDLGFSESLTSEGTSEVALGGL